MPSACGHSELRRDLAMLGEWPLSADEIRTWEEMGVTSCRMHDVGNTHTHRVAKVYECLVLFSRQHFTVPVTSSGAAMQKEHQNVRDFRSIDFAHAVFWHLRPTQTFCDMDTCKVEYGLLGCSSKPKTQQGKRGLHL